MFSTKPGALRAAKDLRKAAKTKGHLIALSACQELVARETGYEHWHDALSKISAGNPIQSSISRDSGIKAILARMPSDVVEQIKSTPDQYASGVADHIDRAPPSVKRPVDPVFAAACNMQANGLRSMRASIGKHSTEYDSILMLEMAMRLMPAVSENKEYLATLIGAPPSGHSSWTLMAAARSIAESAEIITENPGPKFFPDVDQEDILRISACIANRSRLQPVSFLRNYNTPALSKSAWNSEQDYRSVFLEQDSTPSSFVARVFLGLAQNKSKKPGFLWPGDIAISGPTGSGKSHLVAMMAARIKAISPETSLTIIAPKMLQYTEFSGNFIGIDALASSQEDLLFQWIDAISIGLAREVDASGIGKSSESSISLASPKPIRRLLIADEVDLLFKADRNFVHGTIRNLWAQQRAVGLHLWIVSQDEIPLSYDKALMPHWRSLVRMAGRSNQGEYYVETLMERENTIYKFPLPAAIDRFVGT